MARIDHVDIGDGGIADIDRGHRRVEGDGAHFVHGDGQARRESGRGRDDEQGKAAKKARRMADPRENLAPE